MPETTVLATALKSAIVLLACMAAAVVAGVIACTIFDVAPMRGRSGALPYAIWLVLGIFCGLIAYGSAGSWASGGNENWTEGEGARRTGRAILATGALLLAALTLLFHRIYWSQGVAGEYYVPDSAPHSILFFLSVLGGMVLAGFALGPGGKGDAGAG